MTSERSEPILCFGEVLLRLSALAGTRLANASSLSIDVGGAEANVAAMLAQLGRQAEMITVLPTSPLGDLCEAELRRTGVGIGNVIRAEGRLGLYFFERTADGGRIHYDRSHSAFVAGADRFDWTKLASGTRWFHVSGITLALAENAAQSALSAAEAMSSAGVTVSFDVNHRSKLWDGRSARDLERLREIVRLSDVLFASSRDISQILQVELPCETTEDRRRAAEAAFSEFGRLQTIASTRRIFAQDRSLLSARIDRRDECLETKAAPLLVTIGRIGSGDAFVGAVVDGMLSGSPLESCSRRGLAAAILKHGVAGDRWIGRRSELDEFDPLAPADIRR